MADCGDMVVEGCAMEYMDGENMLCCPPRGIDIMPGFMNCEPWPKRPVGSTIRERSISKASWASTRRLRSGGKEARLGIIERCRYRQGILSSSSSYISSLMTSCSVTRSLRPVRFS